MTVLSHRNIVYDYADSKSMKNVHENLIFLHLTSFVTL